MVGQPVLADGSPDPASPDPRPFRLQLEPDGRVYYLDHPEVADLGYLAYNLHLTWGITPAANDQAVLQILAEVAQGDMRESGRMQFADGRLTQLELDWNRLTALPPELAQLQHLESLILGSNQLTALPPELGQLANLETLILGSNQLTTLPPELSQLHNLTTLNLWMNQLTALPPELGQLQYLTTLNLRSNQLTALPPELGQLQNLAGLDLRENPLTGCLPAGWRGQRIHIQLSEPLPFCTD